MVNGQLLCVVHGIRTRRNIPPSPPSKGGRAEAKGGCYPFKGGRAVKRKNLCEDLSPASLFVIIPDSAIEEIRMNLIQGFRCLVVELLICLIVEMLSC